MRKLPTLETSRLVLRPFLLSDAATVQRLAGDRAVADTTLTIPHPYVDGMAEQWIATHEGAWTRHEMANRRAELGYWIGAPYWGLGYATEAGRVTARLGMRHEGTLRRHVHRWDQPEDLEAWGLLRCDAPGSA